MAVVTEARGSLPRLGAGDTLNVLLSVVMPLLGKGVLLRRPPVVGMAERLGLDAGAVRTMRRLRDRHGPGPVLLPLPLRPYALVLSPEHVTRALARSPEPLATASDEKRAALAHFEPHGVLVSGTAERAIRRPYNEAVLDFPRAMHRLAGRFLDVVAEEAAAIREDAERKGELDWEVFARGWWRMSRRVVFGDAAAEDHEVTDILARLRADANWAFLMPTRHRLRARFLEGLRDRLGRAGPGSLAEVMAATPAAKGTDPAGQVPQWLFALDAPARASFRTLAMLDTHPAEKARAMEELASGPLERPFLRACVLDTLRLWPTTPVILRQANEAMEWENGTLPKGAGLIIYAPFFHRDETRLAQAHRFGPEIWLEGRPEEKGIVPFSDGPAECPGRNLALLLCSAMVAELLRGDRYALAAPTGLGPGTPLPGTLSAYGLRFRLR
ncbi:cytochrome P450 [Roseomonas sp. WA12]